MNVKELTIELEQTIFLSTRFEAASLLRQQWAQIELLEIQVKKYEKFIAESVLEQMKSKPISGGVGGGSCRCNCCQYRSVQIGGGA